MSDDQRNLHSLISRLPNGKSAKIVYGSEKIGVIEDGDDISIDLRSISSVDFAGENYKICSPLLTDLDENCFSRDALINNPESILKSLQD